MALCLTLSLLVGAICKPGDAFFVKFFRDTHLSDTFFVEEDTSIYLPMVGLVSLAGLQKSEARSLIQDTLSSFYARPLVKVYPLSRVYLTGHVERPGPVYLMPSEGFIEAVTMAGTRDRADLARVKVMRDGKTIGVDLRRPKTEETPQDGDVVIVPKSPWPTFTEFYYALAGVALVWSLYFNITRR